MDKLRKHKVREDNPVSDAEEQKSAIKRSQRWAAIGFTGTFLLAIVATLLSIAIFSLRTPVIDKTVYYVTADGRTIAEPLDRSIPTISLSKIFVQNCLGKSLQVTSAGYKSEMNGAKYCYERSTYEDMRNRLGTLLKRNFTARDITGGFEVKSVTVDYLHDDKSNLNDGGCNSTIMEAYPDARTCRSFNATVKLDAINYANGKRAPFTYSGIINLIVGSRATYPNGMIIIMFNGE